MIYTGTYELTVDPKHRLSIPAQIRSEMDAEADGSRFYLVPGERKGTLSLYADKYFERYAERYHSSLMPNEEKENFEAIFYSMASLLDIDKQGRVVLPQRLLGFVGLKKQVTMTGARDHLVLWNRDEYAAFMEDNWSRYKDLLKQAQLKTEMSRTNGPNG